MKKHMLIFCTSLVIASLFAGCRRKVMDPTVPTKPLATVAPTTVPTRPEGRPAPPTRESTAPSTAPTRETGQEAVRPTIEDGNGPIASQSTGARAEN